MRLVTIIRSVMMYIFAVANFVIKQVIFSMLSVWHYGISPWFGNRCRFEPTCSVYMKTAVAKHGIIYGLLLGVFRVCRCHPFCDGGYDPVPNEVFIPKK